MEFGASGGPGGGNVAVAEKLLFDVRPPPIVDPEEFAACPGMPVLVVSIDGFVECCNIPCAVSGTAGGDICAPISAEGAELDFLGRLTVADLLNIEGIRALLSEPT